MGNNLGLEIQEREIKLVYLAVTEEDIALIQSIESQYIRKKLALKNGQVLFFLNFTHEEFYQLKNSNKVKTLREHYNNLLKTNIDIYMNTETSINIQANMSIKETIEQLIKGEFTPKNRHTMESSVRFLNIIDTLSTKEVFFRFKKENKANQLHLITKDLQLEKCYTPLPQTPYLLANLRKGSSVYLVKQQVEKIAGSIIGELTIYNIIKAMNSYQDIDLDSIINRTFEVGDNKKADLLVEDIYGKVFTGLGMDGNIIASSLGKVGHGAEASFEDKCKSLILAFGINIAQVIQLQMKLNSINQCVLLANKFHNEYFYFVVQSVVKFFHPEAQIMFGQLGNYMGCLGNIQLNE